MSSDFATCRLEEGGLRRRSRVSPKYRKEGYSDAFDDLTLWLDAIWHEGKVTLVCPRLNNLAALFRRDSMTLDGTAASPKLRHFYRHSLVDMTCPTPPEWVSLEAGGTMFRSPVHVSAPERFRDRNVIVTVSRNNDLEWIEDFARFHAETQGAEGIVFVDNASTLYGVDEIRGVFEHAGLDALVLRTDLPFGPRGRSPYGNTELYLQTCVLNAVRLRYLQEARAVLCCDIDELVLSRTPATIFDTTWRSRFGFTRFSGEWRFARTEGAGPLIRHDDHALRDPAKSECPAKWCIRPTGPLGDLQWRPHILEGFLFNWAFHSRDFTYHHCRQITTGWKRDAAIGDASKLTPAPTALQIARGAGERPLARGGREPQVAAGATQVMRRLGETMSRRFLGLRPSLQVAYMLLVCFLGLTVEEVVDDDPASQELAYIMQSFQR